MIARLSTTFLKNIRQAICVVPDTGITLNDRVYFFEQNKVQSIPIRSLLKQYLLQESEQTSQVEQDSDENKQQQEEYSDDENNDNDQGPSGGRMMPVIELIKGFIPRIVGAI